MLCHLMQNQLLNIDAKLIKKYQVKDLEMRELNDTENIYFTGHLMSLNQTKLHDRILSVFLLGLE